MVSDIDINNYCLTIVFQVATFININIVTDSFIKQWWHALTLIIIVFQIDRFINNINIVIDGYVLLLSIK